MSTTIIHHTVEEIGTTTKVVVRHHAEVDDKIIFRFAARDLEREHTLMVRDKDTNQLPTYLDDWNRTYVKVGPSNRRESIVATALRPGDYAYEVAEEISPNNWQTVLDPILEIEGGRLSDPGPEIPKAVVAVGVGLLVGILAYKALK